MSNKGTVFERQVKHYFLDKGWAAIRSSASSSPVDVYAWSPSGNEAWIQCKSSPNGMRPPEWNTFLAYCRHYDKPPILATRVKVGRNLTMSFFEVLDYKTGNGERQPMRPIDL